MVGGSSFQTRVPIHQFKNITICRATDFSLHRVSSLHHTHAMSQHKRQEEGKLAFIFLYTLRWLLVSGTMDSATLLLPLHPLTPPKYDTLNTLRGLLLVSKVKSQRFSNLLSKTRRYRKQLSYFYREMSCFLQNIKGIFNIIYHSSYPAYVEAVPPFKI